MATFVIDESSYRIDKTAFPSEEEAEQRAAEAARILGRSINVYELLEGELHFAFRVMPDGSTEKENPLITEPGDDTQVEAPNHAILGKLDILDEVAETLEGAGQVQLASRVDEERSRISSSPQRGHAGIASKLMG